MLEHKISLKVWKFLPTNVQKITWSRPRPILWQSQFFVLLYGKMMKYKFLDLVKDFGAKVNKCSRINECVNICKVLTLKCQKRQ